MNGFVIFQSTLPRGSDIATTCSFLLNAYISIHAPSRERLSACFCCALAELISIHAPSRERRGRTVFVVRASPFQSTLPRGSDSRLEICFNKFYNFNPRSLAGATKANEWAIRCVHISIHAPSRERPFLVSTVIPFIQISIHAPSRERL